MSWKRAARIVRLVGAALVLFELGYLVVANGVLQSGVIQRAASVRPDETQMGWSSAYSLWPGRAYVSGFHLRLQDPVVEFRLVVDHAKVDVVLSELLHRKFRATHVEAEGVSYRFLTKVDAVAGQERRLAAFPPIEGLPRPALRQNPRPPPASAEDIAGLWTAQLDDVDATVNELWFDEYRYQGPAHVWGGFALSPVKSLWVGPARLRLEGGTLDAGEHHVFRAFTSGATVTIAPVDLAASPGPLVLHTLTASIQFDAALDDIGVAELYVDGLEAQGAGRLTGDLQVADGRLLPGSRLEATLPGVQLQLRGVGFTGDAQAALTVAGDAEAPVVHATSHGVLTAPLFEHQRPVVAALSGVSAEVAFDDGDLSRGLSLDRLLAVASEVRVKDARAITQTVGASVPLIAPTVLGNGPLIASFTATVTPERSLVRLRHLTLGDGELEGAALAGAEGWSGAAAGHFARIPFGFRLRRNQLETIPLVSDHWLAAELIKAGISSEPLIGSATRFTRFAGP